MKFTDASKLSLRSYPKVFTANGIAFTFVGPNWEDDEPDGELYGCYYTDETGQTWLIHNDMSLEIEP